MGLENMEQEIEGLSAELGSVIRRRRTELGEQYGAGNESSSPLSSRRP